MCIFSRCGARMGFLTRYDGELRESLVPDTGPREAGATVGGAWPTAWASLRGGVLVVAVREAAGTSGTGNETRFPSPNGISDHTPLRGRTPGLMPAASLLVNIKVPTETHWCS